MSTLADRTGIVPNLEEILNADPESFVTQYPDIAAVNLACARGLDNADEDAFPAYLQLIDRIAEAVKTETERCFRLFKLKPAQFHHSEAVYRIFTMEHVFRVQFNIKYDPLVQHQIENGQRWECADSSEIFIHGILSDKRTGTCSSLPTFAIAVGRRLGYPLKLVLVPHHTLYRWDDGKEIFNYQHTESGGDIRPDKYFLSWPRRWTEYDYTVNRQTNVWLHSMTPRQEASKYLCNRAIMLGQYDRYDEALVAIRAAKRFNPINPACDPIEQCLIDQAERKQVEEQTKPWRDLVSTRSAPLPPDLMQTIDAISQTVSEFSNQAETRDAMEAFPDLIQTNFPRSKKED